MCRRGPERQAGAARPDLVNPAIHPSAQPPEPIRVRVIWKDFQRRPAWGKVTLFSRQR